MTGSNEVCAGARRTSALPLVAAAITLLFLGTPGFATTLLPLSDRQLHARSTVIVEGVVLRVDPFESSRGLPETQTTIRVSELFKGRLAGDLVVRDRGGVLPDGRWLRISGRPDYVVGRRVLVFAIPHPDGQYQTAEFTLGKFEVWKDGSGRRFFARDLVTRARDGVHFLTSALTPAEDTLRDYDSFRRMLVSPRDAAAAGRAGSRPRPTRPCSASGRCGRTGALPPGTGGRTAPRHPGSSRRPRTSSRGADTPRRGPPSTRGPATRPLPSATPTEAPARRARTSSISRR